MNKTGTKEYRAWKRLSALPNLFQAIKDRFSHVLPAAVVVTTRGHWIKARALQALRAKRIEGPFEAFVDCLVAVVKFGEPREVLFFPMLDSCFLKWPGELGVKSVWAGHPPAVRMAVDCKLDFQSDLALSLIPLVLDDDYVFDCEVYEWLDQRGLRLKEYSDGDFGDVIYRDEAHFLEHAHYGRAEPVLGELLLARSWTGQLGDK